jgi:hypothetical protein
VPARAVVPHARASTPRRAQAMIHDVGHAGFNNGFLIATCDELALEYVARRPACRARKAILHRHRTATRNNAPSRRGATHA